MATITHDKSTKSRATSLNSILSHRKNRKTGIYQTQAAAVLAIIDQAPKPMTGRAIVKAYRHQYNSEVENSSIRRAINTLLNENRVKVAYNDKCKVTGRKVSYYAIT